MMGFASPMLLAVQFVIRRFERRPRPRATNV